MQILEQEKHELRQRLERREGEWEGRVAELETDVQQLKGELEKHKLQLREADQDKNRTITKLSEQNHSLLEQLSRVSALCEFWYMVKSSWFYEWTEECLGWVKT